uniref:Serpin peptidase inhibitor, clade A (alpha-1 antiproteinase, antitrypsin), member 10a n=1 Tax=Scophthalmus maximus TaxID=52904 RepID=A0A8D3EAX5_SCOMX
VCIYTNTLILIPVTSETVDPSVEDLINRNSDFAARLYRAVASRTDDNVFLSPFALIAGELQTLFSFFTSPLLLDLFQNLTTVVLKGGRTRTLWQGAALLPAQNFPVSPSYQDLVQTKFRGSVQSLAFTVPQEAVNTINRWAQEQTGDLVKEVVTTLDPQTQLLSFLSSVWFPFNSSQSLAERFYVDRYHVAMVTMMFRSDKYFLAYDRLVKVGVLKLPMTDGAAMLVVLPDEGVDVSAVEEEVTAEKIQAWIKRLKKTKLEVQVPRFLLERSYSLKEILQTLDITQVFQDDADIADMGGAKGPRLTQVLHKSIVSVDESSDDITTEGRVNVFSTPPPRLTINRPFIFVIYQQTTGSLLFIGRVVDPTRK